MTRPAPTVTVPVDRLAEIISDAEIARVHGHADFGPTMSPRDVVNEGVLKYAIGYHSGHTQLTILLEHGLITKPRPGSYDASLTKKGKKYARALHSAGKTLRNFAPAAPQAAGVGEIADAVAFMDAAAVMLGRGEMPAPGSDYAAKWYHAHATLLSALRAPSREPEGGAVTADALLRWIEENTHNASWQATAKDIREIVTALATREEAPAEAGDDVQQTISGETVCGFKVAAWQYLGPNDDAKFGHRYCEHWSTVGNHPKRVVRLFTEDQLRSALRAQPQAREVAGPAEPEVGRVIYERIEKLLTDDPQGWERAYLSHLVASVEEVGGYDGPQAREEAQPDLVAINRDQWVPCSPDWLDKHPHSCAEAPRVAAKEWDGHSHYHPANWPSPPAPEAEKLRIALQEAADAVDFFDRVKAATGAERTAVGSDHWKRMEAALRDLAALQQEGR